MKLTSHSSNRAFHYFGVSSAFWPLAFVCSANIFAIKIVSVYVVTRSKNATFHKTIIPVMVLICHF